MTAVNVDRLLAVSLGLRYRPVVTVRRVWVSVSCFWVVGIAVSLMQRFSIPIIFLGVMSAIIVLCLVTPAFCYIKILGSMYVSGKLPTYPSPNLTFCPTHEVSVNARLGEG